LLKDQGRNYDKEFVQNCKWVNFWINNSIDTCKRLKLINEDIIQPIINQLVEVSNMNFASKITKKTQL
jgi:hypothetical protein